MLLKNVLVPLVLSICWFVSGSPPTIISVGSLGSFLSSLLPLHSYPYTQQYPFFACYPFQCPSVVQETPTTTTTTPAAIPEPQEKPVYVTRFITYPILVRIKHTTTTATTTTTTTTEAPATKPCKLHHIILHHLHHLTHSTTTEATTTTSEEPTTKCHKKHFHHKHHFVYAPIIPEPEPELPAPVDVYEPVTASPHASLYKNPFFFASDDEFQAD